MVSRFGVATALLTAVPGLAAAEPVRHLNAAPAPVPEPMSLALVGTGIAGLAARGRLRREV